MRRIDVCLLPLLAFLLLCGSCRRTDVRPFGPGTDRTSMIFPDYQDVTVPSNIAPLNFYYTDPESRPPVTVFSCGPVSVSFRGRAVVWKEEDWKRLLAEASGSDIDVVSYTLGSKDGPAVSWKIHVSEDPIDPYLTYRLIEPGFEVWDDLEIVERNLEGFDTRNISDWRHTQNKCMNCHIHARGRGDLSLFYLRGAGGGAILNRNGTLRKLTLRDSTMISPTVYGEIHPDGRWGVFSTNVIIPAMHSAGGPRMEVFDTASDLCVADFDGNRMTSFPETARDDVFETFPAFSADGNAVYYCAAPARPLPTGLEQIRYSLVRIPFDPQTGTLGTPADTVWSGPAHGASACHPKTSPDGRWLLFTVADYGTFPINHVECDLALLDLRTGETMPLDAVNADQSDTYHSWSSDGKWFVFASKRGDGMFGKPYFSHIAPDGSVTKPFLLPQRDPYFYDKMLRSFNVPDLGDAPVGFDAAEIGRIWREVPAESFE
ncbi:MAG: PD40 domain-containing protein [Bacteroidales bacterium]|nr:PD40 domain-containing protein [Bacteroidales bacterium]